MRISMLPALSWLLASAAPVALADNLLKNSSFEEPKITGRVSATGGSNPAVVESGTSWSHFQTMDRTGKVTVGMTDEIAHTGKQSIYVQFDQAAKTKAAMLMSDLIPIKADEVYRVSIWGRVDRKRPLTLDQGRPYMTIDVEFYPADQASLIGEVEHRTQMIPGMGERILFTSAKWSEYFAEFRAPAGAEFMKITFNWFSPKREEPANGIIFFDDASITGAAGTLVPSLDPPPPADDADADDKTPKPAPVATPAGAPAPAAPPAPGKPQP